MLFYDKAEPPEPPPDELPAYFLNDIINAIINAIINDETGEGRADTLQLNTVINPTTGE